MTIKLRELIRQVRACKTAAEEREVIAKESSALRTAFKDDNPKRHRNVAKLMFIHMLGYPTHFGQMECLKLIAENGFAEKRIGYLGFMLLLDEKQELFMMVTNSVKNDLNNANQFIVGIALCAFANLCSAEMASDLASEVAKLLQNGNPYIRKKAALCCVRIVRKVPDLGESLLNSAIALISDKHHGVLVAGLKLCIVLCQTSSSALEQLKKQTANLVQILKNLLTSEYRAEYDVCGIIDPFLHIEVLRLLGLVGKGDTDSSDIMSDVLAQVMTNTDSSKIPGSAILYECVQTVMIIEATQGLRVLAVNILGRFLSNRDNNIRYVALNMLVKIVYMDLQAIQRHRATVMDCLRDPDVSIRRRALDLVYALANDDNVKSLTKDLLEYLENADREFKGNLTVKICSVIQKFASSKLWYINQMVNLMLKAGEYISNESVFTLIVIISNTPELQGYTVRLFYRMAECWSGQESLALATIWCIGEYGEMLINHAGELETEDPITVTELEVLDVLEMFATDLQTSPTIKAFCLIALLKLSSRYLTCTEQIQQFISKYKDNSLLELQQRSVEFNALISKHQNIRNALVERIPVLNEIGYQGKRADPAVAALGPTARVASPPPLSESSAPKIDGKMDTLNLMNLFDFNCGKGHSEAAESNTLQDMLNIDSKAANSLPTDSSPSTQTSRTQEGNLLDLLSMSMSTTSLTDSNLAATNAHKDDSIMTTRFQKPVLQKLAHKYGRSLSQGSHGHFSGPEVQAKRKSLDLTQNTSYGKQMQVSSNADQYGEMSSASSLPGSFFPSLIVLQSSRLRVSFDFSKTVQNPQVTFIRATYLNNSSDLCTDFMLEAAVPKFMQLRLEPASNNVLPPNAIGAITQNLTVINSLHGQKPLMMRIRITYKVNGVEVIEQAQIENFPTGL